MFEASAEGEETSSQPLLWTLEQVCTSLNLGRSSIDRLIEREGLPIVRFGRAIRVNPISLRVWLEHREQTGLSG